MRNYPGMEMGHHLSDHLQLLQQQSSPSSEYPIEILWLDMPREEQLYRLLDFLQINPEDGRNLPLQLNDSAHRYQYQHILRSNIATYQITIYSSAHIPIRSTSNLAPCLKFVCWFSSEAPPEDEIEPILLRLDAEGGILYFLNYANNDFMSTVPQLKVRTLNPEQLSEKLSSILETETLKTILPMAHATRLLQGLEKISESFSQYISHQKKDIKTKKFTVLHDQNAIEQEDKLNLRELFQQIKGGLQRNFSECERSIQDRLIRLGQRHSPNSLMAQVENHIQQVDHLQEESFAGNIRMTLPPGTLDTLVRTVFQGLRMQIDQDTFAFKEFVKQESVDLQTKLKEHQIPFSYAPHLQINLARLEANIVEYVQFTQKYEAEKKKLEFGDYLRAATKPLMGLMGINFLIIIITRMPFMTKDARANIQTAFYFILFLMIPYAIYSFYKFLQHTKARKAHDYDNELNRMRDSLLSEARGMIRKVTDEWQREIIGALREEQNQLVNTLELVFAEAAKVHKDKIQQTSRSIHARKSALDQRERNHESVLKNKDNYDRSLAQLKGELMNQYQQQLEQL